MFDQLLVAIIGFFTLVALFRGFIRELLGLIGLTTSVIATYYFTPYMTEVLMTKIPSFFIAQFIGGAILFILMLVLTSLLCSFLSNTLSFMRHGILDTILGGILGFSKGCAISFLVYTTVMFSVPIIHPSLDISDNNDDILAPTWLTRARSYPILLGIHKAINDKIKIDVDEYHAKHARLGSMMYAKFKNLEPPAPQSTEIPETIMKFNEAP